LPALESELWFLVEVAEPYEKLSKSRLERRPKRVLGGDPRRGLRAVGLVSGGHRSAQSHRCFAVGVLDALNEHIASVDILGDSGRGGKPSAEPVGNLGLPDVKAAGAQAVDSGAEVAKLHSPREHPFRVDVAVGKKPEHDGVSVSPERSPRPDAKGDPSVLRIDPIRRVWISR